MTDDRAALRADCSRCVALCCVVPGFAASADFAIDKPAGRACPNLLADHRCGIHDRLAEHGFPGCAVFDCFGAGQQVVQVTFGGTVGVDDVVGRVFEAMRPLQELRWYLVEARERLAGLSGADALRAEVDDLDRRVAALTTAGPDELVAADTSARRREGGALLGRVSTAVRGAHPGSAAPHAGRGGADPAPRAPDHGRGAEVRADRIGADLVGADLRRADLRGVSLRGAYLIGADLRDADLRAADLLGTDLRAADLRGADLRDAIFLTDVQLAAARGDAAVRLPVHLERPPRWSAAAQGEPRPRAERVT